jgi:hypothetical protein
VADLAFDPNENRENVLGDGRRPAQGRAVWRRSFLPQRLATSLILHKSHAGIDGNLTELFVAETGLVAFHQAVSTRR